MRAGENSSYMKFVTPPVKLNVTLMLANNGNHANNLILRKKYSQVIDRICLCVTDDTSLPWYATHVHHVNFVKCEHKAVLLKWFLEHLSLKNG